ncbi:MAG: hypothetical protein ACMUEM_02715 [Flavobacteriales bacterium AspAUS03]
MEIDTLTSGTIQISVDESFRPVIQEVDQIIYLSKSPILDHYSL